MARSKRKDDDPKKRISKRRYPPRICPQSGEEFIPTDARQKYLNPQMRIDYNNDKRKKKNADLNDFTKRLIYNERALKGVYDRLLVMGQKYCSQDLLQFTGVDFNVYSYVTKNEKTGRKTIWSLNYGFECLDQEKKLFQIHKNQKNA